MAQVHADEQAIFEVARKIDSRESRQAYLQQTCGGDDALKQRVAALLRAYEESESFLESPPLGLGAAPSMLGNPMIGRPGEGGMGVVYMAVSTLCFTSR
jgi:hypothetical protein